MAPVMRLSLVANEGLEITRDMYISSAAVSLDWADFVVSGGLLFTVTVVRQIETWNGALGVITLV